MSYRVHLSPTEQFVWVELFGTVDARDIVEAMHAVYGGPPPSDARLDVLWDGRGIERFLFDLDGLARVTEAKGALAEGREQTRAAVVAARDLDAEMAVMLSRYGGPEPEPHRVGVFRELGPALGFLDRTALPDDLAVTAERQAPDEAG